MTGVESANLIRVFDFYLAVMALFSFLRRYPVYLDTVRLIASARGRWPRVVARLRQHHGVLWSWPTVGPVVLAFAAMGLQMIASRLVWPQATIRGVDLVDPGWLLLPFGAALLPMLFVDCYFLWRVGRFDRAETEKYLDVAEGWAGTWKSRAVRAATLGRINPNRMVDEEVRKSLALLGQTVSWSMWWVAGQVSLRLLFGLTIWLLWALRGDGAGGP